MAKKSKFRSNTAAATTFYDPPLAYDKSQKCHLNILSKSYSHLICVAYGLNRLADTIRYFLQKFIILYF